MIKEINGARIAVVGQALPRTANANPQEFFPDWSFGLREDDMVALVQKIREEKTACGGIAVTQRHGRRHQDGRARTRAERRVRRHTHDGIPQPIKVKERGGHDCWVTNAGSNSKYVGVMDFDIQDGELRACTTRCCR